MVIDNQHLWDEEYNSFMRDHPTPMICNDCGSEHINGNQDMVPFNTNTDDSYWGCWKCGSHDVVKMTESDIKKYIEQSISGIFDETYEFDHEIDWDDDEAIENQ